LFPVISIFALFLFVVCLYCSHVIRVSCIVPVCFIFVLFPVISIFVLFLFVVYLYCSL
jgi:hypothetical protein